MANNREQIRHYQRKLEHEHREDKVLHILQRLKQCSMTLELLQETGIGKTVNKIRKFDGEAGEKARSLIKQWKLLVAVKSPVKPAPKEDRSSHPPATMAKNLSWDDHPRATSSRRTITVEREDSYTVVDDDDLDDHSEERERNTLRHLYSAGNSTKSGEVSSKTRNDDGENTRKGKSEQPKQNAHIRKGTDKRSEHNGLSKAEEDKKRKVSTEGFDSTMVSFEDCLGLNDRKSSKKKRSGGPNHVVPSKAPSAPPRDSGRATTSGKSEKVKEKKVAKKSEKSSPGSGDNLPGLLNSSEWKSTPAAPLKLSWNDVDVDATLPSIQPNYRPLRLGIPDSPPRKKKQSSEVDSTVFMSSKHNRTQVFSGRRVNTLTEVLPLYDSCIRVLQDNVRSLGFLDGVPYFILKPVLERCNHNQLYFLEDLNPYLLDDTDELWKVLSQRQFKSHNPEEMETWREMFLRLNDERERKFKNTTANIKVSMDSATPVRRTMLADIAKPPRNVARQQAKLRAAQGTSALSVGPMKKNLTIATPAKVALGLTKHVPTSSSITDAPPVNTQPAKVVKKIAPLMQKSLKLMKNRFRR